MERRVLLAFAVAPAVVPLVGIVSALASGIHMRESLLIGAIYAVFTYGAALALGVPVFQILSRHGWSAWWHYVIAGALIGVAVLLPFLAIWGRLALQGPATLMFMGVGVLSATVFWIVGIRSPRTRGDRTKRSIAV
jgi:hypothetical protein